MNKLFPKPPVVGTYHTLEAFYSPNNGQVALETGFKIAVCGQYGDALRLSTQEQVEELIEVLNKYKPYLPVGDIKSFMKKLGVTA